MLQYGLSDFESTQEFLCILAKRTGQLRKGALPDVLAAAKKILHDWNSYVYSCYVIDNNTAIPFVVFRGKIKYFTCPPETFSPTTHLGASIVADMAKEFSLDDADFSQKETQDIEQLPVVRPSATVAVESMGFFEGRSQAERELDVESTMDCDNDDSQDEGETPGKKKKTVHQMIF